VLANREEGLVMSARRSMVLGLVVAGLLIVPALALAGGKPTVYFASTLHKEATCSNTGITGPTGKVTLYVYALKGKHPAAAAVSCRRAIAVGKAGRKYMFAALGKSFGLTFPVEGASYKVEEFIFPAASGPAPGFVGADTVVAAQFASGR
jgi:hypothetical protein